MPLTRLFSLWGLWLLESEVNVLIFFLFFFLIPPLVQSVSEADSKFLSGQLSEQLSAASAVSRHSVRTSRGPLWARIQTGVSKSVKRGMYLFWSE